MSPCFTVSDPKTYVVNIPASSQQDIITVSMEQVTLLFFNLEIFVGSDMS